MDKEQLLNLIKDIGTIEDDIERRTKLSNLTDEVTDLYDMKVTLENEKTKFEEDNEKLRQANMELFLKVGSTKTPEEIQKDTTGVDTEEKKTRKFEDLFDDKGNLK